MCIAIVLWSCMCQPSCLGNHPLKKIHERGGCMHVCECYILWPHCVCTYSTKCCIPVLIPQDEDSMECFGTVEPPVECLLSFSCNKLFSNIKTYMQYMFHDSQGLRQEYIVYKKGKESVVLCIAVCKHPLKSTEVNVTSVAKCYVIITANTSR